MNQQETALRALRRVRFGKLADAANELGVSTWTLRRAETGKPVSASTRRLLELTFEANWDLLVRPFVELIAEQTL